MSFLHMTLQSFLSVDSFLTVRTIVSECVREMLAFNMIGHIPPVFVTKVQTKAASWHPSFISDDQVLEVFLIGDIS